MDPLWIPVASVAISGVVSIVTLYVGRRMLMSDRKVQSELQAGRRKITRQNTDADQLWTLYEDLREEARVTEESLRLEMRKQREDHTKEIETLRREHREELQQVQALHRAQVEEITGRYEARMESFIQFIAQRQGQEAAQHAADQSVRAGQSKPAALRDPSTSEVPSA